MVELRAAHYSLNQQTQKVSGSQESSITEKKKKSTMLGEKRKKKKTDEFPQHIYQSFGSPQLVLKGHGLLAKQA